MMNQTWLPLVPMHFIIRRTVFDQRTSCGNLPNKHGGSGRSIKRAGQGRICWRTTFWFHDATRSFPATIPFFFVVDLKWEEIPSCHLLRHNGSRLSQLTHRNVPQQGPICLLITLTSLYDPTHDPAKVVWNTCFVIVIPFGLIKLYDTTKIKIFWTIRLANISVENRRWRRTRWVLGSLSF